MVNLEKKALNLQNTRSFENQVFVCERLDNVMQSVTFSNHASAKIDFLIVDISFNF